MNSADIPRIARFYVVVGWKYESSEHQTLAFLEPKSSEPWRDVERAISEHCRFNLVELREDGDYGGSARRFIESKREIVGVGPFYELPHVDGLTSSIVLGDAPKGVRRDGNAIYKTVYFNDDSNAPAEDVRLAVEKGATSISVEVTAWGTNHRKVT